MAVYAFERPGAPRADPSDFFNPATQQSFLDLVSTPLVVGREEDGSEVRIVCGFFFTDRWRRKRGFSLFGSRLELLFVLQAANESLSSGEPKSKFLLRSSEAHVRKAVRAIVDPALALDGYRRGAALRVMPQSELAAYYYATRRGGPFGPGLVPPSGRDLTFHLLGYEEGPSGRRLVVSGFELPPLVPSV